MRFSLARASGLLETAVSARAVKGTPALIQTVDRTPCTRCARCRCTFSLEPPGDAPGFRYLPRGGCWLGPWKCPQGTESDLTYISLGNSPGTFPRGVVGALKGSEPGGRGFESRGAIAQGLSSTRSSIWNQYPLLYLPRKTAEIRRVYAQGRRTGLGSFLVIVTEPRPGGRLRPGGARQAFVARSARPGRSAPAGRGRAPPTFSFAWTGRPRGSGEPRERFPARLRGWGRGGGLRLGRGECRSAPCARPREAGTGSGSGPGAARGPPGSAGRVVEPQRAARGPNAQTMRRAARGERLGGPGARRLPSCWLSFPAAASARIGGPAPGAAPPRAQPAAAPPRPGPAPLRRTRSGPAAGWRAVPAGSARPPRGSLGKAGGGGALGAAGGAARPELRGAARAAPAPAARARGRPTRALRRLLRRQRPAPRRFPLSAGRASGGGGGGGVPAAGGSPRGG